MRILVPVSDFSFGSVIAHFIARHRWPSDSEFKVISVVEPFVAGTSKAPLHQLCELSGDKVLAESKQLVETVAKSIKQSIAGALVTSDVLVGATSDTLLTMVQQWNADMVVMGSHGRSGWGRIFLGSTSLTLLAEAACPVFLVKPSKATVDLWEAGLTEAFESPDKPQKILVAIDELSDSKGLMDFLRGHKWVDSSEFELVSIHRPLSRLAFSFVQSLDETSKDVIYEQKAKLNKLAVELKEHLKTMCIECSLIEGDPKVKLVELAQTWGADLIVIGDRCSQGGKKRLGSVALSVLCGAPCSVFVARTVVSDDSVKSMPHAEISVSS